MAIALPIESIVDYDALRRANDAVIRRLKNTRQSTGIRINQTSRTIETLPTLRIVRPVGLKVIELASPDSGDKHAPNISPAIVAPVKDDDVRRFSVVNLVVQQHSHVRRRPTEHDPLHAVVFQDCPIRQGMAELKGRMAVQH